MLAVNGMYHRQTYQSEAGSLMFNINIILDLERALVGLGFSPLKYDASWPDGILTAKSQKCSFKHPGGDFLQMRI